MLVLLIVVPQTRRPVTIGLLAILGVLTAMWVAAPSSPLLTLVRERVLSIGDRGANPYDNRPVLLAEGVRQWLGAPLFGNGPDSYPRLAGGVTSLARPEGAEHAHNLWVTIGAEQGVVGVAAMAGFGVLIVATAHRFRPWWWRRPDRARPRCRSRPPSRSALPAASTILVEGWPTIRCATPSSGTSCGS